MQARGINARFLGFLRVKRTLKNQFFFFLEKKKPSSRLISFVFLKGTCEIRLHTSSMSKEVFPLWKNQIWPTSSFLLFFFFCWKQIILMEMVCRVAKTILRAKLRAVQSAAESEYKNLIAQYLNLVLGKRREKKQRERERREEKIVSLCYLSTRYAKEDLSNCFTCLSLSFLRKSPKKGTIPL